MCGFYGGIKGKKHAAIRFPRNLREDTVVRAFFQFFLPHEFRNRRIQRLLGQHMTFRIPYEVTVHHAYREIYSVIIFDLVVRFDNTAHFVITNNRCFHEERKLCTVVKIFQIFKTSSSVEVSFRNVEIETCVEICVKYSRLDMYPSITKPFVLPHQTSLINS